MNRSALVAVTAALIGGVGSGIGYAQEAPRHFSQVMDIRKGVHCMIPKSVFVNLKQPRPGAG